ncbi:tripartite tricarboxylate transporter substrate binding protein [Variovorax sp. EL159]|uniref:Bug family tripartite tricarboxylate transporter substrate binding protein n=1 Tax=Variovorax sp. EL159 TaxID=1566270 RepID=UPI000884E627|nr:tripartite tricarboxylate transporter substrate binding protein [Variovorax sp. EL159]SCX46138.1 Tripartite-type tricarboxylate transporter, receptor component TctC [Variovorax sp. EL159]
MTVRTRLRALFVISFAGALALLVSASPAHAQQAYPAKPIRLVIPFGAGGITDVAGRLIGQHLGEELKQSVIIDNKAGAGGAIAAQAVAQAAPDGYTLLLGTVGTQVVNKMLYNKLNYDPASFTPVSLVSNSPYVLAINGIDGVSDLKGLIGYAKAHPGKLNFGSAGNGSSPHLAIELFKLATRTDIVHVPFKSGAEAVNAAMGGQVQIVIDAIPVIQPQARTGRLKMLAIAANHRNAAVPDVPTSAEQGLPDFQIGSWNAIVAPAGTPQAQVDVLNQALARALKRPAVVARLAELGIEPMVTGVPAYLAHVKSETAKWSKVVQAAGTKLD